jgi:hypothetical protein
MYFASVVVKVTSSYCEQVAGSVATVRVGFVIEAPDRSTALMNVCVPVCLLGIMAVSKPRPLVAVPPGQPTPKQRPEPSTVMPVQASVVPLFVRKYPLVPLEIAGSEPVPPVPLDADVITPFTIVAFKLVNEPVAPVVVPAVPLVADVIKPLATTAFIFVNEPEAPVVCAEVLAPPVEPVEELPDGGLTRCA